MYCMDFIYRLFLIALHTLTDGLFIYPQGILNPGHDLTAAILTTLLDNHLIDPLPFFIEHIKSVFNDNITAMYMWRLCAARSCSCKTKYPLIIINLLKLIGSPTQGVHLLNGTALHVCTILPGTCTFDLLVFNHGFLFLFWQYYHDIVYKWTPCNVGKRKCNSIHQKGYGYITISCSHI